MIGCVAEQLCPEPTFDRLSSDPSTQKNSSSEMAIPFGMIFAENVFSYSISSKLAYIQRRNGYSSFCFLPDLDNLKLDDEEE